MTDIRLTMEDNFDPKTGELLEPAILTVWSGDKKSLVELTDPQAILSTLEVFGVLKTAVSPEGDVVYLGFPGSTIEADKEALILVAQALKDVAMCDLTRPPYTTKE